MGLDRSGQIFTVDMNKILFFTTNLKNEELKMKKREILNGIQGQSQKILAGGADEEIALYIT